MKLLFCFGMASSSETPYITYCMLTCFRSLIMEIHKQLMVVQHFSAETDFHMSKNMRFGGEKNCSLRAQYNLVISCLRKKKVVCLQVEFNKAAQSLTDAMIPSTQKKTALSRLVKVSWPAFNI